MFVAGCVAGAYLEIDADIHGISLCILYALMLQVGMGIGGNRELRESLRHVSPKILLVPVATITGTLLFSAAASLLLSRWSVFDCMAVGSGFAYYSLSSILITQFKEPSVGMQIATELGTIALLSNIMREMMSLVAAPLIRRYFGKLAPISAAGVNSMDVLLPSITRYSGKEVMPVAILHGIACGHECAVLRESVLQHVGVKLLHAVSRRGCLLYDCRLTMLFPYRFRRVVFRF